MHEPQDHWDRTKPRDREVSALGHVVLGTIVVVVLFVLLGPVPAIIGALIFGVSAVRRATRARKP